MSLNVNNCVGGYCLELDLPAVREYQYQYDYVSVENIVLKMFSDLFCLIGSTD